MHTSLNDVQSEMDFISDVEDKAPLAIETLARIAFITENFKKSLENCNKDLVAITWLDEAERALKNIKSYLSNYKNNKDANMLMNKSNSQLDTVLQSTAKMNCVRSAQSLRGIVAAENEYKRIMDLNNEQLYSKVKAVEAKLESLKNKIIENESVSRQNVADIQQSIITEKQRLDSLGTNYQHNDTRTNFTF